MEGAENSLSLSLSLCIKVRIERMEGMRHLIR